MSRTKRVPFTIEEAARIAAFVGGDGWTIYSASVAEAIGVPLSKVESLCVVHHSDRSNWKETITDLTTGKVKDELEGIHSLVLVETACDDVGGKAEMKMGRGFRASAASQAIRAVCNEKGIRVPTSAEIDAEYEAKLASSKQ